MWADSVASLIHETWRDKGVRVRERNGGMQGSTMYDDMDAWYLVEVEE